MSEDNSEKPITYQDFYNIKIKNFYEMVTDIMHDFSYSVHRTLKDEEGRRRIELWRSSKNDNEAAMIWIELVKNDDEMDRYVSTDVLRTMNEEGLTRLFFFTNTQLDKDTREILDSKNHYIFTPEDILETIQALESKNLSSARMIKKRKTVKVPSGFFQIRNFLKTNPPTGKKIFINTSKISEISEHYTIMVRQIFNEIDRIDNIDDMSQETRDRLKAIQSKLLPELFKALFFQFTERFDFMSKCIYEILENLIVYLGALIEFESEDTLHKCRDVIDAHLETISHTDEKLETFYSEQMQSAQKLSYKLLYSSIGIIIFMLIFYLIMMLKK